MSRSLTRALALAVVGTWTVVACSGDDAAAPATTSPTTVEATPTIAPDDDGGDGGDGGDADPPATTAPADDTTATYTATISRDEHNVPHIVADDIVSLGFGYGYAFAEDHACSLAEAAVQVRSQAASVFGEGPNSRWLNQDLVYAALELRERASVDFDNSTSELRDVVRAYAAGYNRYLDDTPVADLPGYCAGEEWVGPIDEYDLASYFKALSWRASVDPLISFIATAEPPSGGAVVDDDGEIDGAAFAALVPEPTQLASNAWAIGPERTVDGTTMLVGNPHFPWQGLLRFYEVHLTVPGEFNVYGASLLGSPAVQVGFNEAVAWSHTVSAGTRFTGYSLDLEPGDPTSYRYGDETRQMTSRDVSVEVLDDDGALRTVDKTFWFSHYGPIIDFPGLGWSDTTTLTFRDANADNDELLPQFFAMNTAGSMEEFIEAHATWQGIPWVNTIAASADGRIWYADTSATPNLSDDAITAWRDRLESDPITAIAYDNGFVLLDGSDPLFEWVDDPRARDPGVVPFDEMPQLERSDYVFNANDPYWFAHADELLSGFSPLHGESGRPVSNRTRGNAVQLDPELGDAGANGLFSFSDLRDSAVGNRVFTAEALAGEVVERCRSAANDRSELTELCDVLDGWDRRVNLDSVGAALWREFIDSFSNAELVDAGPLWAQAFDPADPFGTPRGLSDDPAIIDRLVDAAERLRGAGFDIDTPLGEIQFADRAGERIPIHGGTGQEGVSNVVGFGSNTTASESGIERGEVVEGSRSLTGSGYPIANGTSFIFALEFTADGPVAEALLTYGQTGDSSSVFFADQTRRFSDKAWRTLRFSPAAIAAEPQLRSYTVTG